MIQQRGGQQLWGPLVSEFMNNLQNCPMFRRVFVQTQIKPAAGFWGLERWKEKASWGLFHLAGAKPRHTGQSILGVWQRTHVGWQMTKMCGLVTVRPPPNPDTSPLPDSYTDGEQGRSLGMLKMIRSLIKSTSWSCRPSVQKDCNMKDSACRFFCLCCPVSSQRRSHCWNLQ